MVVGCVLWVVGCDYRDGHGKEEKGKEKEKEKEKEKGKEKEKEKEKDTCTTKFHPSRLEGAIAEPGSHGRTEKN